MKPAHCCRDWLQLLAACRAEVCMRERRVLGCETRHLLGIAGAILCLRPQPVPWAAKSLFGMLVTSIMKCNDS